MDTLTITLTNARQIDGFITAANGAGMSPEALALEFISQQGARYANDFRIGIITGSAFVARFTPTEYGDILAYSQIPPDPSAEDDPHTQVAALLNLLFATSDVHLDDPRLAPGLALLVSEGLLDAARPAEILAYERPHAGGDGMTAPQVKDTRGAG